MSGKAKPSVTQLSDTVVKEPSGTIWVMLIFFSSGLCSLIDEVVWVRLIKLSLGNTEYASSIVVSVFMGGLALGALIMSRYSDRVKRRLLLYAGLELCATVSALMLPFLLNLTDGAYRFYYLTFHPSPSGLMSVQVLVSAVLLLIPSMVMGSTLPLLSRYVTSLEDRIGRNVGRLYAMNTFGAATGCFLAGFVLIRAAGVMGTLYIAAVFNLVVAFGGWMLSRSYEVTEEHSPAPFLKEKDSPGFSLLRMGKHNILLLAFFTSGLISIGYELIWMRSIVIPLGGFTYVFSAVLTIYLLGNVIGAWTGSYLSRKLTTPSVGFGISLTCLGTLGILYMPWFGQWLYFFHYKVPHSGGLVGGAGYGGIMLPLVSSLILFLLPSITMGIGFPLALQGWSNLYRGVGLTTGTVYGVNTIGAVTGGLITGFILIPKMGAQLSITILGLLGIWLGFAIVFVYMKRERFASIIVSSVAAPALTAIAFLIPSDLFIRNAVNTPDPNIETVAVNEGVSTTVAVFRNADGHILMASNGVPIAGDDEHRTPQKMLGHLGVLLNRNARDVLSIGFGSGETSFCLAQHDLHSIDCVEIAPEVVQAGLKYFSHINLGNQLDHKVSMKYMDAKNYLHLTEKHYDVIINDADVPSHSGSAPMFAKEHFNSALEHLNPGGLVITKLHLAGIPGSSFDSILGTFSDVFPHVTLWFPTTNPVSFLYLVGSREKQVFSPKYIDETIAREGVGKSVAYLNVHNSMDLFSCYVGDENDIRRYLTNFHINSDYKPFVEFNLAQQTLGMLDEIFPQFIEKVRSSSLSSHVDLYGMNNDEQEKWRQEYELTFNASKYLLLLFTEENTTNRMEYIIDGLEIAPDNRILLENKKEILSVIKSNFAQGRNIEGIDQLVQRKPDSGIAWMLRSWAFIRERKMEDALKTAHKAVELSSNDAIVLDTLGWIYSALNQADTAMKYMNEAVKIDPADPVVRWDLGNTLAKMNKLDEAVLQIRELTRIQPRNIEARLYLGDLCMQLGNRNEALNEYATALNIDPNNAWARAKMAQASGRVF